MPASSTSPERVDDQLFPFPLHLEINQARYARTWALLHHGGAQGGHVTVLHGRDVYDDDKIHHGKADWDPASNCWLVAVYVKVQDYSSTTTLHACHTRPHSNALYLTSMHCGQH